MGRYSSGQRGQTVNLLASAYRGSNPLLPTSFSFLALFFSVFSLVAPLSAWAGPIPDEEYEVYSAALSQLSSQGKIGSKLFVINETTKPSFYTRMDREKWSALFQNQLGIPPEPVLADDFIRKNGKPFSFENKFSGIQAAIFKIPVVSGQEAEISWGEFSTTYPEANGLIELSRVGLDKNKTKALLYVGVTFGKEVTNYVLVLAKGQGGWAIAHQVIRSLTPRMQ